MRKRCVWVAMATLLSFVLCATLAQVAAAEGGMPSVLDEYEHLASERKPPAPLVLTSLPPAFGPLERANVSYARTPGGARRFEVTYKHEPRPLVVTALIQLEDRGPGTLARERRAASRLNTERSTRVRGHPGIELRQRGVDAYGLAWVEDGHVFELLTGTPKTVSMAQLRQTAAHMEHLLGEYLGTLISPDSAEQEVVALLSERTISLTLNWDAPCSKPGVEEPLPDQALEDTFWRIPLSAGAFSLTTQAGQRGVAGTWALALHGGAAQAGGSLTFQASTSSGEESCAIGPDTIPLKRFFEP